MFFQTEFFAANRYNLFESLNSSPYVVAANGLMQRNSDCAYLFRQDSNFWYLTGLSEPDLILFCSGQNEYIVLPKRAEHRDLWDGQIDRVALTHVSGISNFMTFDQFEEQLRALAASKARLARPGPPTAYIEAFGFYTNPARTTLEKTLKKSKVKLLDCRIDIARLRQVKQAPELAAIQQAIDITNQTLNEIESHLDKYTNEAEIARDLTIGFIERGASGHAFEPIVASGPNAATIHYKSNNGALARDALLLLDVGAEVSNYAADISRTWLLGHISRRQQTAFDAVRDVQHYASSLLKPGMLIKEYEQQVRDYAAKTYLKHRLINSKQDINVVYPHATSHFMGLDVHDAGDYQVPIMAGSVLTVEPGIYLPEDELGVRVEDDYLITESGAVCLSDTKAIKPR